MLLLIVTACKSGLPSSIEGVTFHGEAQGSTYSIIIAEDKVAIQQNEIDSILLAFDGILSTYQPNSILSRLNSSKDTFTFIDATHYFKTCYEASEKITSISDGFFDPSVYPLVEAWGFFKKEANVPTKEQIDSLLTFTGFHSKDLHKVRFSNDSVFLVKKDPRFKLDFNAIAQGYSVDVVADFLMKKNCSNFYVEIGGEIRVSGKNREGKNWQIGIDKATENSNESNREVQSILSVSNCGIATSGNYRNYFEENGKKFGHTLNPKTGYPMQTDIVSVTVIAPNATLADAYSTVFMTFGVKKTKEFLKKHPEIKVIINYLDQQNKLTSYHSKKLTITE